MVMWISPRVFRFESLSAELSSYLSPFINAQNDVIYMIFHTILFEYPKAESLP
ncbi:MAG: hypothetical protein ACI9IP_000268 [Arcticibacterium sp.]|jgi:hypothetical protein